MNYFKRKLHLLFIISFVSILKIPTYAFSPQIYEPNQVELKSTSISLGKTAAQLLQIGQAKEAVRLAKLAISLNPEDERLWAILAETQIRNKELEEAINSIDEAIKIRPKNANFYFAKASIYMQNKKSNLAINIINKGLLLDTKNANGYFQLGNAKIMENKLIEALKDFKKAASLKKNFWQATNNQGLVLYELGKKSNAIKKWREVIKTTKDAEPLLALATGLYESNKKESIELAIQALEKNPNYISIEFQREQLWGKKLQQDPQKLFTDPALANVIKKALGNSK